MIARAVLWLVIDLHVRRAPAAPPPRTLAMRAAQGATATATATAAGRPAAPASLPVIPPAPPPAPDSPYGPELDKRLSLHLTVGYGVDQGIPLPGQALDDNVRQTRAYSMGDVVAFTRGFLFPQLSSYLAARFYLDQDGAATFAAIPTVFDATQSGKAFLVRSGYVEVSGLGPSWLKPLTLRAGRQYRYGVGIAQFDGATAIFDTRPVEISLFGGRRVALYGPGSDAFGLSLANPGQIGGGGIKIRLAAFAGVPITLGLDTLGFDQDAYLQGTLAIDFTRDMYANIWARVRNGDIAQARAEVRARLSRTSTLQVIVDDRERDDWQYDLVVTGRLSDDADPRRRINLGPSPSRIRAEIRAGTVLFDNWDVLFYGAVARQNDPDVANSFASSYTEAGGALAATFSHGITAGLSLRRRNLARADAPGGIIPLMDIGALGERAFSEGTLELKWAADRRRFVAELEFYGRRYDEQPIGQSAVEDWYTGGRLRLEARASDGLRLLAEYELANVPDRTVGPLGSLQTVRVMGEARF